jgi:hypothetical protein
MATMHEYVMARMKRGELNLLDDEEKNYFKKAVKVGLIKPPQKDMPRPEPQVLPPLPIDNMGNVHPSIDYGSDAYHRLRDDLKKRGTHDLYRFTQDTDPRTGEWHGLRSLDGYTRLRILPKGSLTRRESEWTTNVRQQIGHQGTHKMTDGSGRMVADYPYPSSLMYDGMSQTIPLITKYTTAKELNHLLSGKEPTAEIIDKAENFAVKRMQEGLSPFYAGAGSEKLTPIRLHNP